MCIELVFIHHSREKNIKRIPIKSPTDYCTKSPSFWKPLALEITCKARVEEIKAEKKLAAAKRKPNKLKSKVKEVLNNLD